MADPGGRSLQDVMSGDLFSSNNRNELVETLKFMEGHGTPLNANQIRAITYLQAMQAKRGHKAFEPIIKTMTSHAKDLTPSKTFLDVINAYFTGNLIDKRMMNNNLKSGNK